MTISQGVIVTEQKLCTKCREIKDLSEFGNDSSHKDGLSSQCKACRKIRSKLYCEENKEQLSEKYKQYYKKNKDLIIKRSKRRYNQNKEKISLRQKEYQKNNKEIFRKSNKKYKKKNRKIIIEKQKKYRNANAKYETYYKRLTVDEFPRLGVDGVSLEVKCRYCGKYFMPTNLQIQHRIESLNNESSGDRFLYCSEGCKEACPVYRQNKFPRGFKKVSSREVNPIVRQMCFERDNWECQRCGVGPDKAQLHCHHIEGYTQNPLLGNDIANTITLCRECHKEVHTLPGCKYHELGCNH